jgi:type IV pilus biogenesis protein CpaD/CtpE
MRILGIVALCAALAGCAGRSPAPVQVVQPTDRYMDCPAILAEVQANNERVKQLASDKGLKTAQNVAAGVAGFVVPILWFGMDFQGTADAEMTALQSRQQYLAMMADQKRCGAEPEPLPPPARNKRSTKPRSASPSPAESPAASTQKQ